MINILHEDMLIYISSYLISKDIIFFYITSKTYYRFLNKKISTQIIKNLLHTTQIFLLLSTNFSVMQKQIYNKEFYYNIPPNLNTIYNSLLWFHVHNKLLKYYNLTFFLNNSFLITSNKKMTKHEIYLNLKKILQSYIYSKNKRCVYSTNTILGNNNINTSNNYWYHQVEYKEFIKISYEIFTEL